MSTHSFPRPRASSFSSSRSLPAPENHRVTPRRPATARTLRSSPLARQSCEEEDKGKDQTIPKYRPSRISYTPDLLLTKPSIIDVKSMSTDAITLPAPAAVASHVRRPSTSRDPGTNWVTKTDPTPRFSRLGLGGEGVVMPVSAKSHRQSVSRPVSIVSISSSRTPSVFMEGALPPTSRTTSFSSTGTVDPVDFGILEFHGGVHEDCGTPPNGKLKRMMSSLYPFKPKKQVDGGAGCKLASEPQVKEVGRMRSKWRSIVASLRR